MTDVLYYWRPDNYYSDAQYGFGYHLNQNSPVMEELKNGDHIWAFTRRHEDNVYVMAAEIVVSALTLNSSNYKYGKYRAWADIQQTRYFEITQVPDCEELIRSLGITANAKILAQSFQGFRAVRPLNEKDSLTLKRFCSILPVYSKVNFYAEDEYERKLIYGDEEEPKEIYEYEKKPNKRLKYIRETVQYYRSRDLAKTVQQLYEGKCQVCGFDPLAVYGFHICHAHHIIWISRGGDDELDNMMLICPNHHSAVHQGNAIFDFATLTYSYDGGKSEHVTLNKHLIPASK